MVLRPWTGNAEQNSWEEESKWGEPCRCRALLQPGQFPGRPAGKGRHRAPRGRGRVGNSGRQRVGRIFRPESGKEESWTRSRGWPRQEEDRREGFRRVHMVPSTLAASQWARVCEEITLSWWETSKRNKQNETPELTGARNSLSSHHPDCKTRW